MFSTIPTVAPALKPVQLSREPGMPNARVGGIEFYYDAYRHDPDSIGFDNSYTGPSELELGGGCTRCGCPDDCLCDG